MIAQDSTAKALETPPKVYSYSRWSTPEQAKGDSFRRQARAAEKWAERNGLELDESLRISDEGVSAYRGSNALDGGLSRFLEACRNGLIEPGSFLLVESLDRISRMAPRKAQRLIDDIVDSGVTIVTLTDNQTYDANRLDSDPTALLISLMVSWRAHEESKVKGRGVAEAWEEKRRQVREDPAKRLTKRAPGWLVAIDGGGWKFDEGKAETVRRIFRLTRDGWGEARIARKLNEEAVPVLYYGKQWYRSTVAKVLRNPAVIGQLVPGHIEYINGKRVHVKEDPIDGAFPSVIEMDDWLAVRTLKDASTSNARGRHANRPVASYFASLARCPACGGSMSRVFKGRGPKGGIPKLVCNAAKGRAGCKYKAVPLPALEEALQDNWGALLEAVPADEQAVHLTRQRDDLSATIHGTEDHLQDLCGAFERNPSSNASRIIARIEAELRTMRAERDELDERCAMADRGLIATRVGSFGDLMDDPEKREDRPAINSALKLLFTGIVVDYETGHLRFQWRQGGEAPLVYAWVE